MPEKSYIFGAGCGNGKNMIVRDDMYTVGCDICPNKKLNVQLADIRSVPYRSNTFDVTMSIAVIHHISEFDERIQACNEMIRVTKSKVLYIFKSGQIW